MIEVTKEAAERIRTLLAEDGKQETHGLRMKVIGGGCSGLQYQLSFDDVVREIDTEIELEGVRVINVGSVGASPEGGLAHYTVITPRVDGMLVEQTWVEYSA